MSAIQSASPVDASAVHDDAARSGASVSTTAFVAGSTRSSRSRNGLPWRPPRPSAPRPRCCARRRRRRSLRRRLDRRLDGAGVRVDAEQVGAAAGDPERALRVDHPLRCVAGEPAERRRDVRRRVDPLERAVPVVDDPDPAGVLDERRGAVARRDRRNDAPGGRVVAQERARLVVRRPHGARGRPDVGEPAARDGRARSGPSAVSIRFTIGPRSALQTAPRPAAIEYGVLVSRRIARVSPVVGEIRCRRACWRHDAHSAPLAGSRESAYCGYGEPGAAAEPERLCGGEGRGQRRSRADVHDTEHGAGRPGAATVRRRGRRRAGDSGSCRPVSRTTA